MKTFNLRFIFITSAILLATASRLMPHIPNFTPIAAMALFGGAYYSNRMVAILVPLAAMLLSDLFIGMHNTLAYVYVGFIITTLIGMRLGKNIKVHTVLVGSLVSSIIFFVITNYGVWAASGSIAGLSGLTNTYFLGIPFFGPTLLGDLFFNALLFGAFYLAQLKFPKLSRI